MPRILEDRVLETSVSVGAGNFALAGAVTGYRRFNAVCAVADTVPYFIEGIDAVGLPTGEYEYGTGTYSAANTLTRTTVLGSSNAGALVVFSAGTKNVGISLTKQELSDRISGVRVDVASAATVDLTAGSPASPDIRITGTTGISAFTVATGRAFRVVFQGALTLTNGASLVTNTGADIKTQAGDSCTVRATAANTVEIINFVRAFAAAETGSAGKSMVRVNTNNGYGSTNTKVPRFSTVVLSQGSDITYADSATLGASFTINTAGVYGLSYCASFAAAEAFGITRNVSSGSTALRSLTLSEIVCDAATAGANGEAAAATVVYLSAGDVIRPHTLAAAANGLGVNQMMTVTRVA